MWLGITRNRGSSQSRAHIIWGLGWTNRNRDNKEVAPMLMARAGYMTKFGKARCHKKSVFAWRLSQDGLATQLNRKRRTLTKLGTCDICGREDENGHHAVVNCTKAMALRYEMRKYWMLPDEEQFRIPIHGPRLASYSPGTSGPENRSMCPTLILESVAPSK